MSERVYQRVRESDPYDLEGGPKKWRWHEPVTYNFPEGWARVAALADMTPTHWRVLGGLIAHLDWNNRCRCTYSSLGRSLGLARETVSRAMPRLVTARLVCCERQRPGQPYEITLSPYLCWKGRPWHLARARQDFQARWQLQHGHKAPSQPRRGDAASPGVGDLRAGKDPSIPHHLLTILRSL